MTEKKERKGVTWLASYPKSGNTWLRLLMSAYRRNGLLNINDTRETYSDGGTILINAVSAVPATSLDMEGQFLLRPAALQHFFCHHREPVYCKTHFVNIRPDGDSPHLIPKTLTKNAIYIVRDPRSVAISASRFFQFATNNMVDTMNFKDFTIGGNETYAHQLVSSWSNHVASWVGEKDFPVHVVKYEDMLEDPARELTEVLEFLGEDVDKVVVKKAVKAAEISRMQKAEKESGFAENNSRGGEFFGSGGGTRWEDELGPKFIRQIEEDHGDIMRAMGYLDE